MLTKCALDTEASFAGELFTNKEFEHDWRGIRLQPLNRYNIPLFQHPSLSFHHDNDGGGWMKLYTIRYDHIKMEKNTASLYMSLIKREHGMLQWRLNTAVNLERSL